MNNQAPWFYSADLDENVNSIVLNDEESRHVIAARRLEAGDAICITNGRGLVACGVIGSVSSRPLRVTVDVNEIHSVPPGPSIHLASALPKGDRQKMMLDMATQAGMAVFTPVHCERSVASSGKNAIERWQRVAIESSKQCRRVWLPELKNEVPLTEFLHSLSPNAQLFLASAEGPAGLPDTEASEELVVLVGPEGGFTGAELDAIRARCRGEVRLAPNVLRTETAAVLGVAYLSQLARDG